MSLKALLIRGSRRGSKGRQRLARLPPLPGFARSPSPPALSRGLSPGPAVSPDLPVPGRPFGDSASFCLSFCYSAPLSVPPRFSASSTALGTFFQARALSHSSMFQRAEFSLSPPIAGLLLSDSRATSVALHLSTCKLFYKIPSSSDVPGLTCVGAETQGRQFPVTRVLPRAVLYPFINLCENR